MEDSTPRIKIKNKESERPIVKIGSIPVTKSSNFIIEDDNSSVSTASVVSLTKKKHRKKKKPLKEVNLFPQEGGSVTNKFEKYSNPKKTRHAKVVESDDDSESDSGSDISGSDISGSDGGSTISGTDISDSVSSVGKPRLSWKEIEAQKQDYLLKLQNLENKGIRLTTRFTMKSELEDMKLEYNRHKKLAEQDAAVKFSRKMLMACVTGMEYLNGRFDPFNVQLNGWSESIMENIGDYDTIFERLAEKYAGKAEMAPELELMLSLAGSAFMFHLTKTMFGGALPGMGDVMKQNPEMMANIAKAMSQSMNTNEKTTDKPQTSMQPPGLDIGSLMGGLMSSLGGQKPSMPVPQDFGGIPAPLDRPMTSRTNDSSAYTSNDNDRFSDVSSEYSNGSDMHISIPSKGRKQRKKKDGRSITIG
jgi:hypothetical protein